MRIHVRLFGALRDKLPPEAKGSKLFDLPEGTAVAHLLAELDLQGHIQVAVNEEIVENWQTILHDGDTIEIFRPSAGGAGNSIHDAHSLERFPTTPPLEMEKGICPTDTKEEFCTLI